MMRRVLGMAVFAMLISAGGAFAQCTNPDNWLGPDRCGFDTPASVAADAWRPIPIVFMGDPDRGIPTHSPTGGLTSPGSMFVDAILNPDMFGPYYAAGAEVCVQNQATVAGDQVGFGMHINLSAVPTGGSITCSLWVSNDPSTDCSVGFLDGTFLEVTISTPGTYQWINDAGAMLDVVNGGGNSMYMSIACTEWTGTADFIMTVDDAYLGPSMVPVELQSFSIE